MKLVALGSPLIKSGDNLINIIIKILKKREKRLAQGDILVVASKIVALSQEQLINLKTVSPTPRAKELAKIYAMPPAFVQIILNEADEILGGVPHAILTKKDGFLVANSGADQSNVPDHQVILWPKKSIQFAEQLKDEINKQLNKKIGVIISDSHCVPLRRGTYAQALAIAGFEGLEDSRRKKDLYGRELKITLKNVADSLATAANLMMGEAGEKTPLVLIKGAPINLSNRKSEILTQELKISRDACLFKDY